MSITRKGKEKEKRTAAATSQPEIQHYFLGTRSTILRNRTVETQSDSHPETVITALPAPAPPAASDSTCVSTPRQSTQEQPASTLSAMGEGDIKDFLQPLPTHADMKTLILHIEEEHCRDFQAIWVQVQSLADRISTGEGYGK